MTSLSVVIVSWNSRDLTLACLSELMGALSGVDATRLSSAEIIVVDNGSLDGTSEAVKANHPNVELVTLDRNVGFAKGANAGMYESSGSVILLLNTDARMTCDAIERCLDLLDQRRDVGAVTPQLLHANGRLQNSIHAFPSWLTELVHIALLEWIWPGYFPSKRYPHSEPLAADALLGAAFFVRRRVLEEVGPLDEGYFFFFEETDWCWQMREAGWKVMLEPRARIVHLSGVSSKLRFPALTRIEYHRSLYRFLRLHRSLSSLGLSVVWRVVRGCAALLLLLPIALFSGLQRSRLLQRWRLLSWHLRGCPGDEGLAQLTGSGARVMSMKRGRGAE